MFLCMMIIVLVGSVRVYDLPSKQLLCHNQYTSGGSSLIWAPLTVDPSATTIFAGFTDGVVRSAEISTYMYITFYICTKGLALPCLYKNAEDFEYTVQQKIFHWTKKFHPVSYPCIIEIFSGINFTHLKRLLYNH